MQAPSRRLSRRLSALAVTLAVALTAAACSEDKSGNPSAKSLSKAEFVSKANAVCSATIEKVDAVAEPESLEDVAAFGKYFGAYVDLFGDYLAQLTPLVAQAADSDELTSKWLAVEEADFARMRPDIEALISAAEAKDMEQIQSLLRKLDETPDHSSELAEFMESYGLTDCAELQRS